MPNILAMDVGGTHFRVALFDASGKSVSVYKGETLRSGGREWMLDGLRQRAEILRRESTEPVASCGISFGGPVDFKRQRVTSVHTPGWENFPLAEWIHGELGLPCRVDNDANAGALGEFRFGAGRGTESVIYITHSTGIGSGIICNGKLHRGRDGMAGEIGHLPLRESDDFCTCGLKTGCTEALASGRALDRMARDLAEHHPEQAVRLLELCGGKAGNATARELVEAAKQGEAAAVALFSGAVRSLALALVMAIRLIDPDRIILGGGVAEAGDFLLHGLKDALKEWWSDQFPYTTEIVRAELGDNSPLYGAAALALELV
ncbi:MAG: ROK family protein [Terriglobia bacterium]